MIFERLEDADVRALTKLRFYFSMIVDRPIIYCSCICSKSLRGELLFRGDARSDCLMCLGSVR